MVILQDRYCILRVMQRGGSKEFAGMIHYLGCSSNTERWTWYGNLCMRDPALGIRMDLLILGIVSSVSSRSCTAKGRSGYMTVQGAACKENGKSIEVEHHAEAYEIINGVSHRNLLDISGGSN